MTASFEERLNQILPTISEEDFLSGRGLGNEMPFFIFEYPAEEELRMREHIDFLVEHLGKLKPSLRVAHVNLFDFVIDHLRERKLLEKTVELQKSKGDDFVLRQLEKILHPDKLAPAFGEKVKPKDKDLVLVSGVGSVWPLMRTHTLLTNLQSVMGRTPFVMFYPGRYDKLTLHLFDKITSDNYYRAFRLIP